MTQAIDIDRLNELARRAVNISRHYYQQYHRTRHSLVRAKLLIRLLKAENAELKLNGPGFTDIGENTL